MTRILHVGLFDKFPQQQLDFLAKKGALAGHFMVARKILGFPLSEAVKKNAITGGFFVMFKEIFRRGISSDKIIIHSLTCRKTLTIISLQPWLLKKSCWIIWGGDLYQYHDRKKSLRNRFYEALRRRVIERVPEIFSATPGDGDLCRQWYKPSGQYVNIFTYPNSIVDLRKFPTKDRDHIAPLRILVGNNAYPSNQHFEAFRLLKEKDDGRFGVICPLAYGDPSYREEVCKLGNELFGERFHGKTEMLPLDEYTQFLSEIDIAIFNNNRQQGMGNIRQLIGFGKKVYMQPNITSWEHLKSMGIKTFSIYDLDLSPHFEEAENNRQIIAIHYSEDAYMNGLKRLFLPINKKDTND